MWLGSFISSVFFLPTIDNPHHPPLPFKLTYKEAWRVLQEGALQIKDKTIRYKCTRGGGVFVPALPSGGDTDNLTREEKQKRCEEAAEEITTVLLHMRIQTKRPDFYELATSACNLVIAILEGDTYTFKGSAGFGHHVRFFSSHPDSDIPPALCCHPLPLSIMPADANFLNLSSFKGRWILLIADTLDQFARGIYGGALIGAWTMLEMALDLLWKKYVTKATASETNPSRKIMLKDTRSYTASVRTEVLRASGVLPLDLAAQFDDIRKDRNHWGHSAKASQALRDLAVKAVTLMIRILQDSTFDIKVAIPFQIPLPGF